MARLRNKDNIANLLDGQIFLNFNEETPKIGEEKLGLFGYGWHTAGWLADGSDIPITKEYEEEDISVLGAGAIDKKVTPGDITVEFTAVERNEVLDRIAWREENGVLIHDGKKTKAWIAIVTKYSNDEIEVKASREMATLTMENVGDTSGNDGRTVTALIHRGVKNDAFEREIFEITADEDGNVSYKKKIFKPNSEIKGVTVDTESNISGEDVTLATDKPEGGAASDPGAGNQ